MPLSQTAGISETGTGCPLGSIPCCTKYRSIGINCPVQKSIKVYITGPGINHKSEVCGPFGSFMFAT